MYIVIGIAGCVLAAFGIIVLLRYHDRPGGTIKWLGLELTSSGAGLPLVALGLIALLIAATLAPPARDKPSIRNENPPATGSDPMIVNDTAEQSTGPAMRVAIDTVTRPFYVSETNSDHRTIGTNTKSYEKTFRADSGYVIVDYQWNEVSATRQSDLVINILDGGSSIQMTFKLKAGPSTDRYRGWLRGTLVTTQIQRPVRS